MWWAGSKAHDVYVGTRAIAVCLGSERLVAQAADDFDGAIASLREWLSASHGRPRLRIWLSGGLCRPFVLPPVPGIKSRAELQHVAGALALQHTGLSGECSVWVDGDDAHLAAAVQQSHLDALTEATRDARLASIRPWWADVLRAALHREPDVPAVAAQDCDSLTLLAGRDGRFDVATTLTPVSDRETADSALARLLLSVTSEAGQELIGRLLPWQAGMSASTLDIALSPFVECSR